MASFRHEHRPNRLYRWLFGFFGMLALLSMAGALHSLLHHQPAGELALGAGLAWVVAGSGWLASRTSSLEVTDGRCRYSSRSLSGKVRELEFASQDVSKMEVQGTINWVGVYLTLASGASFPVAAGVPRTPAGKEHVQSLLRDLKAEFACPIEVESQVAEWFDLTKIVSPDPAR